MTWWQRVRGWFAARPQCEGWRIHGRACDRTELTPIEYVAARELDSVEGYTKEILPLIRRAPVCTGCASQGLKHWPFEFVIAFFDAPTKCRHPRATPTPIVGLNTSSGCPDCGAVFRVGNGTWLGSAQDFGDGDGLNREQ